jgi:hypothetical protein
MREKGIRGFIEFVRETIIALVLGLTPKKRANKRSRPNELENAYYRDVGDTIPDN